MVINKIDQVTIPLESYIFLLICRSPKDYATIDQEHVSYIKACKNYELYCHIEPFPDSKLFKLYRLDHWTEELERREKQRLIQEETRLKSNIESERRQAAINKLQKLMPTLPLDQIRQMISWVEEGKMPQLKRPLGL